LWKKFHSTLFWNPFLRVKPVPNSISPFLLSTQKWRSKPWKSENFPSKFEFRGWKIVKNSHQKSDVILDFQKIWFWDPHFAWSKRVILDRLTRRCRVHRFDTERCFRFWKIKIPGTSDFWWEKKRVFCEKSFIVPCFGTLFWG
jgi:hypothetical protein